MAVVCGLYEKFRACLKSSRCHQTLLEDDPPAHAILPPCVATEAEACSPRCTRAFTNPFEPLSASEVGAPRLAVDPWRQPVQCVVTCSRPGSSTDEASAGSGELRLEAEPKPAESTAGSGEIRLEEEPKPAESTADDAASD